MSEYQIGLCCRQRLGAVNLLLDSGFFSQRHGFNYIALCMEFVVYKQHYNRPTYYSCFYFPLPVIIQETFLNIDTSVASLERHVTCPLWRNFNPLNTELNPICYLLALLGVHHFLHVCRIRVKSLTLRLLMSYIYMEHLFLMFLDHTQRRITVGRTPLDE